MRTHTLSPDTYIYGFPIRSCNEPNLILVGQLPNGRFPDDATELNPGDKLIVHGTEIVDSVWNKMLEFMSNGFWVFTSSAPYYHSYDSTYACFAINSEGSCVLLNATQNNYDSRYRGRWSIASTKLPFVFDWSAAPYGVKVPNSPAEKDKEIKELKAKVADLQEHLQDKDKNSKDIVQEKDDQIKGLEGKLEDKQKEIDNLNDKLSVAEEQLKETEIKAKEHEESKNNNINMLEKKLQEKQEEKNSTKTHLENATIELKLAGAKLQVAEERVKRLEAQLQLEKEKQQSIINEFEKEKLRLEKLLGDCQGKGKGKCKGSGSGGGSIGEDCRSQYPVVIDPQQVIKSRRRRMSNIFVNVESPDDLPCSPELLVSLDTLRVFNVADENVEGQSPGEITVYTSDDRFHDSKWWFVRARDDQGNVTMIAAYDGRFVDKVFALGSNVNIPFHSDATFMSNRQFFIGLIRGVGLRFISVY